MEKSSSPSVYASPYASFGGNGTIVFVSGQLPRLEGALVYSGRVGAEVSLEQAQSAAGLCAQRCLEILHEAAGEGGRVLRILKVTGFVASTKDFTKQPAVIDAASAVFYDALGDAGRHARSAIGVASLPHGACVEVEIVASVT